MVRDHERLTASKPPADFGLFPYSTSQGDRYGVRLRIRGRLWQRQGFRSKKAARAFRDKIRGELHEETFFPGKYARRRQQAVTIAMLLELVVEDYQRHGRKSLHSAKLLRDFWVKEAGDRRADHVTGTTLIQFADKWGREGLTTASINRRMTALLRGYRLGREAQPPLLTHSPVWHKLTEAPARSGFVERPVYETIRDRLPAYARIPTTIAFWTGMRFGEICEIQWRQVRFEHGRQVVHIHLAGSQTKTSQPRMVIMGGDLYETLQVWHSETQLRYPACPWVCHYRGRQISSLEKLWKRTMLELGVPFDSVLFHDLRRTGVRNLVRAGVPEKIAMAISGHRTRSVFDRYNIVNEEDLEAAGRRVVAYLDAQPEAGSMSSSMSRAK
jgi:integrase